MHRDLESNSLVRVWPLDKSGKAIGEDLLEAAQRNWARIRAYAQRHQQDSSQTVEILEASLLATSRARRTNIRLCRPIRNLDNYLYWAFVRRLNRRLAREPKIETVGSLQDLDALSGFRAGGVLPSVEQELLIKEVMSFLDDQPRRMLSLRITGHSWGEIAAILNTTANNAQVLFNQGLKSARNRVMKSVDKKSTSGKGGETHE